MADIVIPGARNTLRRLRDMGGYYAAVVAVATVSAQPESGDVYISSPRGTMQRLRDMGGYHAPVVSLRTIAGGSNDVFIPGVRGSVDLLADMGDGSHAQALYSDSSSAPTGGDVYVPMERGTLLRLRDMGDGTHAPVMFAASSAEPSGGDVLLPEERFTMRRLRDMGGYHAPVFYDVSGSPPVPEPEPAPEPPPFSPLDIDDLTIWVDSTQNDTITYVSDRVSAIADLSGNGNHLTQTNSGNRPIVESNIINGLQSLRFFHSSNETGLSVAQNASLVYSGFTMFVPMRRISTRGVTEFIGGKWATIAGALRENVLTANPSNTLSHLASSNGTSSLNATFGSAMAIATNYLVEISYDNSDRVLSLAVNGGTPVTNTLSADKYSGNAPFMMGGFDTSKIAGAINNSFNGWIPELAFFTRRITSGEAADMRTYFNDKYEIY